MTATQFHWFAAWATMGLVLAYELWLLLGQRLPSQRLARMAHAELREDWLAAISNQRGSEVLAVQTLRNAVMAATLTTTTATLASMGALSLFAPMWHAAGSAALPTAGVAAVGAALGAAGGANWAAALWPSFTPRLAMDLTLLALLFASLVASALSVRYYNHAGFVAGMPVESPQRLKWAAAGRDYMRKAGFLYGWGLRQLLLVVPVVAFIMHPLAGVVASVALVWALLKFDQFHAISV